MIESSSLKGHGGGGCGNKEPDSYREAQTPRMHTYFEKLGSENRGGEGSLDKELVWIMGRSEHTQMLV